MARAPVRVASALLATLVFGACQAVLPRSERSDFFLLTSLEPPAGAAAAPPAPTVLIGPVVLPPYLDRRELVTRVGPNQLRIDDLELWAEPLRESVPMTLEHDLGARLGGSHVGRSPWTGSAPPDVVVSVELRRFERTSRQTVELAAVWTIADGHGGTVRARRDTRLSRAVASKSTQAAVTALSDALADLGGEIASELRRLGADAAAPRR